MSKPAYTTGLTERLSNQIDDYRRLYLVQINVLTKRRKVSHLYHFIEEVSLFDVRQLSSKLIQLHLNHLAEIGYSQQFINMRRGVIKHFCKFLIQSGDFTDNPCDHVRNPLRRKKTMPHYLTDDQMAEIYRFAANITIARGQWTLYEPILLAAKTGLTVNEIQIIRWNYFDFCGKLIMTFRSKTNRVRAIPLHRVVIEVFGPRQENDGYVFKKPNGYYYSIASWHRWIDELQKLVPNLRGWHDFRRSFAVKLGKAGVPPIDVMHYLGHANLETTMRYMNYAPSNYNPNIEYA